MIRIHFNVEPSAQAACYMLKPFSAYWFAVGASQYKLTGIKQANSYSTTDKDVASIR